MARFEDLPHEILVEVIRFLTCEKATLHCLAMVNRKTSRLATQKLAYDVDIYVQTEENALSLRYDHLMSSLDRRPELSFWPREITIRCEAQCDQRRRRSEDPNLRANELLRRLPNIRSLSIDWNDKEHTFVPDFLRHREHRQLKEVTILHGQSSLDEIGAFRTTASLSSIVAKNLDSASKLSSHLLDPDPAGHDSPRLKLMDLGGSHFPHTELRRLFELFPTVTTLACAIPGREESTAMPPERHSMTLMTSLLSPGLVAQAFAPLQEGLVELKLNDGLLTIWPGHDQTRMDLGDFTCLKVLHVPSGCFFEGSPLVQRKGVRTLLPPSLEEFNVWFDLDDYFLYTDNEMLQCFSCGQYSDRLELENSERYTWLSELISANLLDNKIFRLRKVTIEERLWRMGMFPDRGHLWELPSALHKICNDAELALEVRLRKP